MKVRDIEIRTDLFYHASRYTNLKSILKNGIRKSDGTGFGSVFKTTTREFRNLTPVGGVYLTKSVTDAYEISREINPFRSPGLICEVEIGSLELLLPDEDDTEKKLELMIFGSLELDYRSDKSMEQIVNLIKRDREAVSRDLREYFKDYKDELYKFSDVLTEFALKYALRKLSYKYGNQNDQSISEHDYHKILGKITNLDVVENDDRVRFPTIIGFNGKNRIKSIISFSDDIITEYGNPSSSMIDIIRGKL